MDGDATAQLRGLEQVITEFFRVDTDNGRKAEIEVGLAQFKQQRNAWQISRLFLQHTDDAYVQYYLISVFQFIINKLWVHLEDQERMEIREFVYVYLSERYEDLAPSVRNAAAKTFVDIGKQDWPHAFPQFYDSLGQMLQDPKRIKLALQMLREVSEELSQARHVSAVRKAELRARLTEQMPQTLAALGSVLDAQFVQTCAETEARVKDNRLVPADLSSPTPRCSPSEAMFNTPAVVATEAAVASSFKMTPSRERNVELALLCVRHMFSWVPLSAAVTPALLGSIFNFARVRDVDSATDVGALALGCFNELLSRHCVPRDFEEYLIKMFLHIMQLLQSMTEATAAKGSPLDKYSEDYLERFTEFLHLFVENHQHRIEANPAFTVSDFLLLVFKYTFLQKSTDSFFQCLAISETLLEHLKDSASGASAAPRYKESLTLLATELLKKIQFSYNAQELASLDNATITEDNMTEWQTHSLVCCEVIALVAELFPGEVVGLVAQLWQTHTDTFANIRQFLRQNEDGSCGLEFPSDEARTAILVASKDLETSCLLLSCMSELFMAHIEAGWELCSKLAEMLKFIVDTKLNAVDDIFNGILVQGFSCLGAYTGWLRQLQGTLQEHAERTEGYQMVTTTIISAAIAALAPGMPPTASAAGARLLLACLTVVRPKHAMSIPSIGVLLQAPKEATAQLPASIRCPVYTAMASIFLLRWHHVPNEAQEWDARAQGLQALVQSITGEFKALAAQPGFREGLFKTPEAMACVASTCELVTALLNSVKTEQNASKALLVQCLRESIQITFSLFPVYVGCPGIMHHLLAVSYSMFESVATQLGPQATQQAIGTFLAVFSGDQLQVALMGEGSLQTAVAQKLLEILSFIVQENGKSFKEFLPEILALSVEKLYPLVAKSSAVDVKQALFLLFQNILVCRWRFFFSEPHERNQQAFVQLMDIMAKSLSEVNPTNFKLSLETLTMLNSKHLLFSRDCFKPMVPVFLQQLLTVFIQKTHNLLRDELCAAVYDLAGIDFGYFRERFLAEFLQSYPGFLDEQRRALLANFSEATDQPSFAATLEQFAWDADYFLAINAFR